MAAPHIHILKRIQEDYTLGPPTYGQAEKTGTGDSSVTPSHTKKEGEEFKATGEEKREVEIADKILAAAKRMASTPDVEEIIRSADELKKIHGKT